MARPTFPQTLREFRERFAAERACLNYMWESRWPEGFECPQCGWRKAWPLDGRRVWECQGCGLQISPTAGTLLHRSHFPLREWFWGAYLVATHTPGLSATQLQRQMGCSDKTAWFLLQRLRRAMVHEGRSPLAGRMEGASWTPAPGAGRACRCGVHPQFSHPQRPTRQRDQYRGMEGLFQDGTG